MRWTVQSVAAELLTPADAPAVAAAGVGASEGGHRTRKGPWVRWVAGAAERPRRSGGMIIMRHGAFAVWRRRRVTQRLAVRRRDG